MTSALTLRQYAAGFDERVAKLLPQTARTVAALGDRLGAAGLEPDDLDSVAALDRLPVLTKDALCEAQARRPPFGGNLAPGARVRRIFQSPGPLNEPEPDEPDPWRCEPALRAAGFTADDLVLNAFSYHLTPAGAMIEEACKAIGCTVIPGGVGNKEAQATACADLGVTAYAGLPSYLKALLEAGEQAGLDPCSWPLAKAFVGGEALPPSLRAWLRERVPTVLQGYATAEAGNLGYECAAMDGLHVPADALVQVCDLETGQARYDEREGQVVVTVFSTVYPLVRFGTGDLSAWAAGECACGEPTPRLRGWLGRVGDAVKVRGLFVHPRQVARLMDEIGEVAAYRFVVDRIDHRDLLRCEIVPRAGADPARLATTVRDRARSALRLGVEVVLVDTVAAGGPIADVRVWD
ncbi:MAG: phenylacetate--CoA ligase family protein [Egibacteraceae bacterium]